MRANVVLAPTDFSKASDGALKIATHESAARGATLLLLHVVEAPSYASPAPDVAQRPSLLEQLWRDSRRELEARAARVREAGVRCEPLLREGIATAEILRAIDEREPELVVMATQGWGGLQHFLLGSVTDRVLRSSRAPMLVLPSGALPGG